MSYYKFPSLNIWDQSYKIMEKINEDVTHRIQAGWLKWKKASRLFVLQSTYQTQRQVLSYNYTSNYTI